jgi:hypothetical protein
MKANHEKAVKAGDTRKGERANQGENDWPEAREFNHGAVPVKPTEHAGDYLWIRSGPQVSMGAPPKNPAAVTSGARRGFVKEPPRKKTFKKK